MRRTKDKSSLWGIDSGKLLSGEEFHLFISSIIYILRLFSVYRVHCAKQLRYKGLIPALSELNI